MPKKINYLQFKEALQKTGKTYFTLFDLKKFYPSAQKSLKTLLTNWSNKGLIQRLIRGFYAFEIAKSDYLRLANEIDKKSYLSFEYALYYYNLINQVPSVITLATKNRSRQITAASQTFEYTHLKDGLFFGYELKEGVYVAAPEKALADLMYLISRGKRIAELDSLDKNKINQKKLQNILKKYPAYTQKLVQKIGL